jgi:hypothetical protein
MAFTAHLRGLAVIVKTYPGSEKFRAENDIILRSPTSILWELVV